jgi:cysteine sulfinate desulfinase/cysteine desulfurase-like protein
MLVARRRAHCFHVDAAQAVGKIPMRRRSDEELDFLSLTRINKMYGPKGCAARVRAQTHGLARSWSGRTAQERGLRISAH